MSRFTLISFDTCPYVERSRIVLHEKDQEFDQKFIDLGDKPDWFLDISPRGKVPVLVVDDEAIFESSVINEFLDEVLPTPPMLPDDAVGRAAARSWIEYNNQVLMAAHGQYLFADDDQQRSQARSQYRKAFERLNHRLSERDDGPYFTGPRFGLVDASIAPIFTRWDAMKQLGEASLLDGLHHLDEYRQALLERPSVQRARGADLTEKTVDLMR